MEAESVALPFTEKAKSFVEESGYGLAELVTGDRELFEGVRGRARERVLRCLRDEDPPELDIRRASQRDKEVEALSYPLTRVIVSCIDDRFLVKRFAEAEAGKARSFVEDSGDPIRRLEDMGYGFDRDGAAVGDFLVLASGMVGEEWKLVNRPVEYGRVELDHDAALDLFTEAARREVERELPLSVSAEVCSSLERYLEPVRQELERRTYRAEDMELDESCFPPCMELLVKKMEEGEGLPHTARFAVTSFLRTVGVEVDEIVQMFNTSPDFDEEKTRYQVEHISGDSSGIEYTPPSCQTMKTYGNCPTKEMDEKCEADTVTHPLSYYRWALKDREDEEEDAENVSRSTSE